MFARGAASSLWRLSSRGAAASSILVASMCKSAQLTQNAMLSSGSSAVPQLSDDAQRKMAELDIVIYQYAICPFCNKVKALLDFYDVAYHVTEVNPLTKKQISHVKDYRKVPIASIGGELVTDSPRIVEAIEAQIAAAAGKKDANFFSEDAQAWTTFADKELAVLLFPNMTRSFNESYQAFSYVNAVPTFSYFDKVSNLALGSTAMWLAQGKLKKKYNIDNEREALFSAVRKFEAAIEGSTFLGGASPHMGDIAVFGVLRAIKDTQAFRDVLEQTKVGPWYERMADVVGSSSCKGYR